MTHHVCQAAGVGLNYVRTMYSPVGQWQRSVHSAAAAVLPYSRLLLTIASQGLKSAGFAGYLWAYKYLYYDMVM